MGKEKNYDVGKVDGVTESSLKSLGRSIDNVRDDLKHFCNMVERLTGVDGLCSQRGAWIARMWATVGALGLALAYTYGMVANQDARLRKLTRAVDRLAIMQESQRIRLGNVARKLDRLSPVAARDEGADALEWRTP